MRKIEIAVSKLKLPRTIKLKLPWVKLKLPSTNWNCCDTLGHRTNGILDSLSCIPDSKAQDFGFHKQTFRGFRNPDCLFFLQGENFQCFQNIEVIMTKISKIYAFMSLSSSFVIPKDSSDTKTLANVFNWPENYRVKNLSLMK